MTGGADKIRERSVARHRAAFACDPAATAAAPGRVNLIGEHIDYNGGAVLPAAIAPSLAVSVGLRRGGDGADFDAVSAGGFDDIHTRAPGEPRRGRWSDYVAGALDAARARGWFTGAASAAVESNSPPGAGLSSSAAVVVATLKAAAAASRVDVDDVDVALTAKAVENDFIGVPCGVMDQMAVSVATPGSALFLDTTSLAFELAPLPASHAFIVVHSGVERRLEDGRYAERRRECEAAAAALGVGALCGLPTARDLEVERLPAPLAARARHAVREHRRVLDAAAALKTGAMTRFGGLMGESHASMRDDFEVSIPRIDALVERALQLGAVGARLTGGGFGGCLVVLLALNDVRDFGPALTAPFPGARVVC